MCSLFVDKKSPLIRIEQREGDARVSTEVNTLGDEELPKEQRLLKQTVMILMGPNTFSAGDAFANNRKVLKGKSVTIVGEPEGGGANSASEWRRIGEFQVYIPDGEAVNPIQKEKGERNCG